MVLPVGAIALYLILGSPNMPGEPLAARLQAPNENRSVQNMIAQVEDTCRAQSRRRPRLGSAGAGLYALGRFDDAVGPSAMCSRLNGSNAAHEADLGEAQVFAANGVVTDEAKKSIRSRARARRKGRDGALLIGMAADQDGRRAEAEKIWRGLLAKRRRVRLGWRSSATP